MKGLQNKYFVLNPNRNDVYGKASRAAIIAYAEEIISTDKDLADDLRIWIACISREIQDGSK